jgi:hypothetical protein
VTQALRKKLTSLEADAQSRQGADAEALARLRKGTIHLRDAGLDPNSLQARLLRRRPHAEAGARPSGKPSAAIHHPRTSRGGFTPGRSPRFPFHVVELNCYELLSCGCPMMLRARLLSHPVLVLKLLLLALQLHRPDLVGGFRACSGAAPLPRRGRRTVGHAVGDPPSAPVLTARKNRERQLCFPPLLICWFAIFLQ